MSLAGLLTVVVDDPQLQVAVSRAEAGPVPEPASPPGAAADGQATTLAGEDLVAPPTLRPVLAAALAHGAHGDTPRFVLAVTKSELPIPRSPILRPVKLDRLTNAAEA